MIEMHDKGYLMHGLKLASLCRIRSMLVQFCVVLQNLLQDSLKCSKTGVRTGNKVSTSVWMQHGTSRMDIPE